MSVSNYLCYVCLSNKSVNFWRTRTMSYLFLITFPPLITESGTSQLLDKCLLKTKQKESKIARSIKGMASSSTNFFKCMFFLLINLTNTLFPPMCQTLLGAGESGEQERHQTCPHGAYSLASHGWCVEYQRGVVWEICGQLSGARS